MKLLIFGQPDSYVGKQDLTRLMESLERSGREVEHIDALSRSGVERMAIYDVVTAPAFVVVDDDGGIISSWQHEWPSYEELSHAFGAFA